MVPVILQLNNTQTIALFEDKDGKIWVGGEYANASPAFVAIIDPVTDSVREFPLDVVFENTSVFYIAGHPQQKWMSFVLENQGLGEYSFGSRRFNFYNTKNGDFPFDDIASVIWDRNGD